VPGDEAGRAGNAGEWLGPGRSATAQELAAAGAGSLKHFFAFVCENCWR